MNKPVKVNKLEAAMRLFPAFYPDKCCVARMKPIGTDTFSGYWSNPFAANLSESLICYYSSIQYFYSMTKRLLLFLTTLFFFTSCELLFPPDPFFVPPATTTGENTVGFYLGIDGIIPTGGILVDNLGHNVQSNRIYVYLNCKNERRGLNYRFNLEVQDSLYEGAVFKAQQSCRNSFSYNLCVNLEDRNKQLIYAGNPNHTFELRVTRLSLGDWQPIIRIIGGDTLRLSERMVICSGTFSGVLATESGDLITIERGRFDFSDYEQSN
jgi:hypothetical protein